MCFFCYLKSHLTLNNIIKGIEVDPKQTTTTKKNVVFLIGRIDQKIPQMSPCSS
jgi:hypothetical protein